MMLNLEDILNKWEEDSKINQTDLSHASIETAMAHSRYLKLLSLGKLQLKNGFLPTKF